MNGARDVSSKDQGMEVLIAENARLLQEIADRNKIGQEMAATIVHLQVALDESQLNLATMRRQMALVDDENKKIRDGDLPKPEAMPTFVGDSNNRAGLLEDAEKVTHSFRTFLKVYYLFKKAYNLPHTMSDVRDISMGLGDKVGRLQRLAKHEHRNDPLPDSRRELESNAFGTMAYVIMLALHYDIDMRDGVTFELVKAVEQHAAKVRVTKVEPEPGTKRPELDVV